MRRDRIQNKGKELVEKKINEGLKTDGYRIQCLLDGQNGSGGMGTGVKSPIEPPLNGSGMTASMGTGTLLDSPPVVSTPTGPTRVMDYEVPAAAPPPTAYAPPPTSNGSSNGSHVDEISDLTASSNDNSTSSPASSNVTIRPAAYVPEPEEDRSIGMLKEVLDIFGGSVVHTEK